mmetsp:Transcript_7701/g.14058  ORF Transcript_7701/g.14058 Transcript_7701/m.14058 type:complete len:305 (+) Transcript_7701:331-1245(+)
MLEFTRDVTLCVHIFTSLYRPSRLGIEMKVSSIALALLFASVAIAFSPTNHNKNHHVIADQSSVPTESKDDLAVRQALPQPPPSVTWAPTLRGDVCTERRPNWLVSSSSKAAPSPLSREMLAAKRKMIEEKRQWEAQKELEVKSRVAMLRQRNAARLHHARRSSAQQQPVTGDATTTTPLVANTPYARPKSLTCIPQSHVTAARQRVEEKRQLAKWEATKNVEVKSRVAILRERNARLAHGRAKVTDSHLAADKGENENTKPVTMPHDEIPLEKMVALETAINMATTEPYKEMVLPANVERVTP